MARIAFLLEHEEGHLNPTFCLARRLAARGHSVAYLCLADGGNYVRSQGFEFHPILEKIAPAGTLRTQREMAATGTGIGGGDRGAEMQVTQAEGPNSIYRRSWFEMVRGDESLDRAMRAIRPDLLLLTSFFAPHALALGYRYRVRIVLLTPMLRTYGKTRRAELLGDILMDSGAAAQFIGMVQRADPTARKMADIAARVMALREVILCPAELEIPEERHDQEPDVHYAEASVDLDRKSDRPFAWELLDSQKRLLYVSLGSQSYRADRERVTALLRTAGLAFAGDPDWQVLVSTGGLLTAEELGAPPGTIVASWAPQIEILRRARVAITHGGLGTVKECIFFGVPMVVFPLSHDQPDNARRVVHHGLGGRGDLGAFSKESIREQVLSADAPAVHANMERMRQRFVEVEASGLACRLIEEALPR